MMGVDKKQQHNKFVKLSEKKGLKVTSDKGGDPDKFKKFYSHDVLTNPEKATVWRVWIRGCPSWGLPGEVALIFWHVPEESNLLVLRKENQDSSHSEVTLE